MMNPDLPVPSPVAALVVRQPAGVNFKPLAAMDVPLSALKDAGVPFERELDDLDGYEIAYFSLGAGRDFAVMRYDAAPDGAPMLLVSHEFFHQADNAALVRTVAQALNLPVRGFQWRSERGELATAAA